MTEKQLPLFDDVDKPVSEADKTWQEAWQEMCDRKTLEGEDD